MSEHCLLEAWKKTPSPHIEIRCSEHKRVGVSDVGFARLALAHGNTWFGKGKGERAGEEEPLIPGPHGHPWYGAAACCSQLLKVKVTSGIQILGNGITGCIRKCKIIRRMLNIQSLGYCYL